MKAFSILEDGSVFTGESIGSAREVISEIVFNTAMAGYMEVLTDPSYVGQSVVMTYPLIGNYGICYEDMESEKPWVDGFIVRELSRMPSNFRSQESIQSFLERNDIPGISGIDTRALVKLVRSKGIMNGMITTNENYNLDEIIPKIKQYKIVRAVERATCQEVRTITPSGKSSKNYTVAVLDLGMRKSIEAALLDRGCAVTVYPAFTKAEDIINSKPEGIVLTNGPGDPKECKDIIDEVKKLVESRIPIFGIGLGHLVLALANGFNTSKMANGHYGMNYPVKNVKNGKVELTSQNHRYVVNANSIKAHVAEINFTNINDGTVEGLHYLGTNAFSVQFNPKVGKKSVNGNLYDEFINMMEVNQIA
ncbi:MAG: carbamoyl phosphate synthase small subunit [Clostridiales bacterium]|nr:carbamoyl phosphate synthase small subunit [Clostridiales bacterium]